MENVAIIKRLYQGELLKLRHSIFYLLHLSMVLLSVVIVLTYFGFHSDIIKESSIVPGYAELIAMAFPILISILCTFCVELEKNCGNFKEILSCPYGRYRSILSKIAVLLSFGFISVFAAFMLTYFSFKFIFGVNDISLNIYWNLILISFGSEIFLYIFHLWLCLAFNKGVSLGIGIFESLLCALTMTGLGEVIWKYLPCAWNSRLCSYYLRKNFFNSISPFELIEYNTGIIYAVIGTILCTILFLIYFRRFQGSNMD